MQNNTYPLIGIALASMLLLAGTPATAESLYQVDMIVFALTDPAAREGERWPDNPGQPETGGVTTPGTGAMISPKDGALASEWGRLESSARYRPLAYFRWRQAPGSGGRPSKAVVESTGRVSKSGPPEVLGTVSLSQDETVRADVDLLYSDKGKGDEPSSRFRLHETRTLREGALQYLDHAVFGALIQISPAR